MDTRRKTIDPDTLYVVKFTSKYKHKRTKKWSGLLYLIYDRPEAIKTPHVVTTLLLEQVKTAIKWMHVAASTTSYKSRVIKPEFNSAL